MNKNGRNARTVWSLPAKPAQSNLDAAVDGLALSDLNIDSCIVASKLHMTDTDVTPLVTPIYQTSTYTVKSVEQFLGRIGQVRSVVVCNFADKYM